MHCSDATRTVLGALEDVCNQNGFDGNLTENTRHHLDSYGGGYFPGAPKVDTADPAPRTYETGNLAGRARRTQHLTPS